MINKKLNKYLFSAFLLLIAMVFLYLTNRIYTLTLDDAKKNHQMQQLEMAKVVTEGIKYFITHLVQDMNLLANNSSFRTRDEKEFRQVIDQFRLNYDQTILSSVVVTGNDSRLKYISGKQPPEWVEHELNSLVNDDAFPAYVTSNVYPENPDSVHSGKAFLIILPFNRNSENKSDRNSSFFAFLINFDSLIGHFILPLKLNKNDFIWILDQEGRLIYHPRHEEMLFNSIFQMKEECRSCHDSFDEQIRMVKSAEPSYGEYNVKGDEPGKIFAYVPLGLGKQNWFIAISTLYPEVISGLKDRFTLFFILGVMILVTMLSFVFMIYFLNLKRIKSEEEKKNLERITEFQEQLFHSSKLASIGEIVDSVAHEINTPMGVISAHADSIALQHTAELPQLQEDMEVIKRQTKRISDYTRSLLNFSRRMPFQPEQVDLVSLINESLYLLNPRLREKMINIQKEFVKKSIYITGDKRQLEQVFINLLNNAIDAITAEGIIRISLIEHDRKVVLQGNEWIEYVEILVEDNGAGISKDNLHRVFEPFFTTKKSSGTGLGLSIAKSIIQRHRGTINARSKDGKGTTFFILLPRKADLNDAK